MEKHLALICETASSIEENLERAREMYETAKNACEFKVGGAKNIRVAENATEYELREAINALENANAILYEILERAEG